MSDLDAWKIVRAIKDLIGTHHEYMTGIAGGLRGEALQERADAWSDAQVELKNVIVEVTEGNRDR